MYVLGSLLFVSAHNRRSSFTGRCHDVASTLRIYQPIIISIYHQVKMITYTRSMSHNDSNIGIVNKDEAVAKANTSYELASKYRLPILYEDDLMVVYNKPSNMLSVPGKEILIINNVQERKTQWLDSIKALYQKEMNGDRDDAAAAESSCLTLIDRSVDTCALNNKLIVTNDNLGTDIGEALKDHVASSKQLLDNRASKYNVSNIGSDKALTLRLLDDLIHSIDNVPRKKDRFIGYLKRLYRLKDSQCSGVLTDLWMKLVSIDYSLHHIKLDSIPQHLISASDIASESSHCHVHHVHRLDLQTSGVLMFAKDDQISADLDRQFRDRHVSCFM